MMKYWGTVYVQHKVFNILLKTSRTGRRRSLKYFNMPRYVLRLGFFLKKSLFSQEEYVC